MSDDQEEQQPDQQPSGELVAESQQTVLAAMQVLLAAKVPVLLWGRPRNRQDRDHRAVRGQGWVADDHRDRVPARAD